MDDPDRLGFPRPIQGRPSPRFTVFLYLMFLYQIVTRWLNTCLCVFKIFYRLWFNTCMCAFKISHGLCIIEYMYDFDFANIWMSFKCQHLNAWICPCDSCIIGLFYAHIWMSNLKSCIHSLRFFSLNNSNVMNAFLKMFCTDG